MSEFRHFLTIEDGTMSLLQYWSRTRIRVVTNKSKNEAVGTRWICIAPTSLGVKLVLGRQDNFDSLKRKRISCVAHTHKFMPWIYDHLTQTCALELWLNLISQPIYFWSTYFDYQLNHHSLVDKCLLKQKEAQTNLVVRQRVVRLDNTTNERSDFALVGKQKVCSLQGFPEKS